MLVPQREQVGAFDTMSIFRPLEEDPFILPIQQIRAREEKHLAGCLVAGAYHHMIPVTDQGYLRVPEIRIAKWVLPDHRISRVFRKVDAVIAPGHGLGLAQAMGHRGIEQVKPAVLLDGGAGEAAAVIFVAFIRIEGDWKLLPTDQVFADRMAPMHPVPVGTVGVMLEEGMVSPLEKDQTVGIVHPALLRLKMVRKAFDLHCISPYAQKWKAALMKPSV